MRRLALLILTVLVPAGAAAQTADNVLVVVNGNSPVSIQIGEYYAKARGITADHVVYLKTAVTETIQRGDFEGTIEAPLANWLVRQGLQDQVLYLVLTKGVPLRVAGTAGREGSGASVDSELTLLYRKLLGKPSPALGRLPNPYFLADRPVADARSFTRFDADTYLVTRLDGFSVDDVLKLIDRGMGGTAAPPGKVVLDERAVLLDKVGDQWLADAADWLKQSGQGERVLLEASQGLAATDEPVIGYYSWGSNDAANRLRHFGLHFAAGAIGGMFVSTDGRTFVEPPTDWVPGGVNRGQGVQSLAGDLIRDGITGLAAHVDEPFLDATIRPQVLFPAYLSGFNLAESFYLSMPFLSWQTVVIGDPLCAPFRQHSLTQAEIAKGLDPDTGVPALFAERRLAVMGRGAQNEEAVKLLLKAEVAHVRENRLDEEKFLIGAADLEPRLNAANLRLASLYEGAGDFGQAIERYHRILSVDSQNVVALNNLAFALAEGQHAPAEALPFAEKAFLLGASPLVADTLGWIHHLLGDDQAAVPLIERALAGAATNVDVQVHGAVVHAALNDLAKARVELAAALKLNPGLASRADIAALVERVKKSGDIPK